jgi:pyruvate, water dikinase
MSPHLIPAEDDGARHESRVILEFLRKTDYPLLTRIARRMLNHLCWNGVAEAHELLQRFASDQRERTRPDTTADENRPLARTSPDALVRLTDDAFGLAAEVLPESEIAACIERWIKDDKTGFLIQAAENQCTSLGELAEALDRYREIGIADYELSLSTQNVLRVSLARRFLTEDAQFIRTAKNCIEVHDFCDLVHHVISPPTSRGKLGGKSSGLLLAKHIVRTAARHDAALADIRVPKTYYVTTDGVLDFIEHNHLQDVYNRKYLDLEQIRREYPHIVQVFKNSHFSPDIVRGLSMALDDLGDGPIIVRSSSLLEDRLGAAFSGKYKSLFLANTGSKTERLGALMDAIAEVYASVFSPDPIEYRAERGLLDVHEEMGIMIQEVVGRRVGRYFLPAFAGVAFSTNEFRWSSRIRREDGLLRIVPGLGTRAVDRLSEDYPILIAPGQPGLRVNTTAEEVLRYAPRHVDAINLEAGVFETVPLDRLLIEAGREYPAANLVFSACEPGGLPRPVGFGWDPAREPAVATFDGLVTRTRFLERMRSLLALLAERIGGPVDLEFASDGESLYLLQCRPQSFSDEDAPAEIPADVPPERVIFSAQRFVSNGRVPDLTHVVYVDPHAYSQLPDLDSLRAVGRVVGRLNQLLPKRRFVLVGPGRWGSRGDIKLGVSVTYSDISNTAMLVEVGRRGGSAPEVSFGTHFFQDLVESAIRYLPLFPGEAGTTFNEGFLLGADNALGTLLPEYAHLAGVVRVIDVPAVASGAVLRVLMNADLGLAVAFLASPGVRPPVERQAAGREW